MKNSLHRKKVAIMVADGFEQSELEQPRAALEEAGAETQIVSPEKDQVPHFNAKMLEEFAEGIHAGQKA